MEPVGWEQTLDDFAARKALPGCGAATAVTAALGSALLQKVLRLAEPNQGKQGGQQGQQGDRIAATLEEVGRLRDRLAEAAASDSPAYEQVLAALRIPRHKQAERRERLDQALLAAAEPPLNTARAAVELLKLVEPAVELGKAVTATDARVAGDLILAAARGGLRVVEANLDRISDPDLVGPIRAEVAALRKRVGFGGATGDRPGTG